MRRLIHRGLILLAVAAAAWARPSGAADATAKLTCETRDLYAGQLFQLVLEISLDGVQLSGQLGIDGLPPSAVLQLDPFQPLATEPTTRDGRTVELRRFRCSARALTPGPLTVAPILHATALEETRSYFFVQQYQRPLAVRVAPLQRDILPLPAAGRPDDFSGAVGRFTLQAGVAPRDVAVGDLVNVTLTVEGDGSLEGAAAPRLAPPAGFRAYDLQPVAAESRGNRRVYRQTLVPLNATARQIPTATFAFFDPYGGQYRRAAVGPFALAFHEERAPVTSVYVPTNRPPGEGSADLRLKPLPLRWRRADEPPLRLPRAFWLAQSLPLLGMAIGLTLHRIRRKHAGASADPKAAERRSAP